MSVHSTNMHHSASFCTSSIFVFCSRCASCQQNYNFCYHPLPIFWLQDQFWQVCGYWILLRQMKAWEKRTNYECTFDQYASFCTKQLSYYLQQTWFLSTKLQFLLLQVTILWLQDQFWQVWLLNSAQTNEGLRKKEHIMSAHSTNVHHSAPSGFRVFCSRLGSCQQNCNFCCQMLKPCWLLPHAKLWNQVPSLKLMYLKRFWTGTVLGIVIVLNFESFFFALLASVSLGNKNRWKCQHYDYA